VLVLVPVLSEAVLVLEMLAGVFVSVGLRRTARLWGVGKVECPLYAIAADNLLNRKLSDDSGSQTFSAVGYGRLAQHGFNSESGIHLSGGTANLQ
jgi:hypothetical protein